MTRVESLTGFGEMLGHRVVTLHPAVHAGILARRDVPDDLADLAAHEIEPFDLVVVNLYPFTEVAAGTASREEDAVEMIDIGGPALLRAAAKNFAHVVAARAPRALRGRPRRAARARRALARHAPLARRRDLRRHRRVRVGDRGLVRRPRGVPRGPDPDVLEGPEPRLRREPAPAGGLLRGGGRAPPPALAGRPAERPRALLQQPQRPLRRPPARRGVHAAGVRDRQAREPVRRGGRRRDRGRIRAGARLGSRLGVRRRRRPQPARAAAALGERLAEQFVEVLFAPGYDGDGARRARAKGGAADPRLDGAPRARRRASATTAGCSAGCSPRTATRTSRTARG